MVSFGEIFLKRYSSRGRISSLYKDFLSKIPYVQYKKYGKNINSKIIFESLLLFVSENTKSIIRGTSGKKSLGQNGYKDKKDATKGDAKNKIKKIFLKSFLKKTIEIRIKQNKIK